MRTQANDKTKWSTLGEKHPGERAATAQLSPRQIPDLRVVAAQMTAAPRRAFQAEMTLKYCHGSARLAETPLGWSRRAVEVGLAERRTGMICLGVPAVWS